MSATPNLALKILPETRAKLDAIAIAKRWKLKVVIDEAVNSLMLREGITVDPKRAGERRQRQTA